MENATPNAQAPYVIVKLSNGTQQTLNLNPTTDNESPFNISVLAFKELAATITDISPDCQRAVYKGRVLKDTDNLEKMGVENGHTIQVVRGNASTKSAAPANTRSAPAAEQGAIPAAMQGNPFLSLFGNNPMMGGGKFPATGAIGAPQHVPDNYNTATANQLNTGMGFFPFPVPSSNDPTGDVAAMLVNPIIQELLRQMAGNKLHLHGIANHPMIQGLSNEQRSRIIQIFVSHPDLIDMFLRDENDMAPNRAPSTDDNHDRERSTSTNPLLRYRDQLEQLLDMGFPNQSANLAALESAQGNIDFAIERLLNA